LMRHEKALYDKLLQNAILLCERSLEGEEDAGGQVFIDGASNILMKPDFVDTERMRELFRTFEEKSRLVKILNECMERDSPLIGRDVQVVIGRENITPSMQDCALITAPYRLGAGQVVGAIGVVGPMRIEYARMMSVVNYVARHIERILWEEHTAN
jgi:heat-inducible transcriptional repressor